MRAIKMLVAVFLVQVAVSASAQTTLVGITNKNWQYFATRGGDPGLGWQNVGFNDSTWLTGRGLFGFDTGYPYPFVSVFQGPGNATTPGPLTSYYRTHFNWVGSTAGVILTMTNFVDDGAVFYLNGKELMRTNMPDAVTVPVPDPTTLASGNLTEGVAHVYELALDSLASGNPNPLVAGDNVLAVSVHNVNATSSDTVFGLSVGGAQALAPCTDGIQPTNRTIIEGLSTTFTVVQGAGCGVPAPTFQWYRNVGVGEQAIAGATSASYTLNNAMRRVDDAAPAEYYCRLINNGGPADSRHAVLTLNADVTAPRLLSASIVTTNTPPLDLRYFLLITDEELCNPTSANVCMWPGLFSDAIINSIDPFSWHVYQADDLSVDLVVADIVPVPGNPRHYLFKTDNARNPDKSYRIQIDSDEVNSVVTDKYGNRTPVNTYAETAVEVTAISVRAAGSALYNFDTAPGAKEFATFTFAGGGGDYTDATALNTGVMDPAKNIDKDHINLPLADATGTPPGAATGPARRASEGHYLITRPTGTAGEVIMAHLRNDSGAAQTGLVIDYDLTVELPVVEEVLGHLVYYSFSGAQASWTQIPGISANGAAGLTHENAILDFTATPWAAGADLYILFVDDNGSGTPDNANEIDNFRVTFPISGAPTITLNPQSVGTNEGATVHLDVAAAGSAPLSYQWFTGATALTDGGSISGATTTRLTIAGVTSATIGNYFCRVSNGFLPNADSTAATVSITTLDTTRPTLVSATGSSDGNSIALTFSKQMAAASVQNTAAYRLVPSGGGAALNISGAALAANGTTVTLTTANRPFPSAHTLTITGVTDNRQSLNVITSNPTIVTITRDALVMDAYSGTPWKYNTNSQDATLTAGTKWFETSFNDSAWPSGLATFGADTGAPLAAAPGGVIMTPLTPNSVGGVSSNDFVTTYFRKSVTLTASPAGSVRVITHYIDDGATFYLDGTRFARFKMTNNPPVLFADRSSVGGEAIYASEALPPSTTLNVPHLLAIEVHQNGVTTSDVLFAAQVEAIAVPLIITHNVDGSITVSWRPIGGLALFSSATVNGTYTATAGANNATGTLTVAAGSLAAGAFYELRYIGEP